MKYKLITTDFDGTLLNSKGQISKRTLNKLIDLKNKGNFVVGVTGRILASVINKIDLSLFDYLILCDGAFLYDCKKNKIIIAEYLPNYLIHEITNLMNEKTSEINYSSNETYYIYKNKALMPNKHIKEIKDITEIKENISRIILYFKNSKEVEIYNKIIKEKYKEVSSFIMQDSFSDTKRINITSKNVNKLTMIVKLSNLLKIKTEEIIYFGDGLNDLVVMNSDIYTVSMGNALKEIKEKSSDTTLTNDEDGVVVYLEKIGN